MNLQESLIHTNTFHAHTTYIRHGGLPGNDAAVGVEGREQTRDARDTYHEGSQQLRIEADHAPLDRKEVP
jgi:hypothetical protein